MSWPLRAVTVIAAVAGHVGAMRSLDHEAKLQASLTDLDCEVRSGDLAKVKQELRDDPGCVNRVTWDGQSAITKAAYNGYFEIVKLLLKHGAHVNDEDGGGFPLIQAAYKGNVKMIKELVRYGAKVDPPGKSGAPLFSAIEMNNPDAVKALIKYKANVNAVDPDDKMQRTPLHKACGKSGSYETVQLLVNAGANLNAKDRKGLTPLSLAVDKGWGEVYIDTRMITPLLDAGAEVNVVNNKKQTALHRAVWDPDALQLLLEHKADVNAKDKKGRTPLLAALEEKEVEPLAVEYLLDAKADVNATDEKGTTPLMAALKGKEVEPLAVELLLDAKADVNVKLNHSTPLHLAVKKNLTDVTEMLLAAEADVNVKDADGKTPFDYAEGEVKELLKKHGGAGGESWRLWSAELKAKLKKKLKELKAKLS